MYQGIKNLLCTGKTTQSNENFFPDLGASRACPEWLYAGRNNESMRLFFLHGYPWLSGSMSSKCHLLPLAVTKATGGSPFSIPQLLVLTQLDVCTGGSLTACCPIPCLRNKPGKMWFMPRHLWPLALMTVKSLKSSRMSFEVQKPSLKKTREPANPEPLWYFIIPT